ncbi:type II secretion system minor pseudopilin GspJ [Pseudoalteromonas sp. BDTF-M6]|uniref:type II secretion system minor pseudopilin GspJ n=2 Tax=unclassified Pseudoalteromonas TaxID=194690 RepID=UPI0020169B9D|nr:type II secretion system minor pseudopilin GspJ [Pseudoalteromonas sp. BDTF-M6]
MKMQSRSASGHSQRAFTLVEVLVALGVMAFIIAATHQIFEVSTRTKDMSEETLDQISRLQTVFRVMEQDFSQISKRKVRNEAGDFQEKYLLHERFLFGSELDGIAFVRNGWTNPGYLLPRSELQAVAYRVQEGRLERLYRLYVDQLDSSEPRVQVLLQDVEDFSFEFFDGQSQKWQEQWQQEQLPKAVAVDLLLKEGDPIRRLFLLAGQGADIPVQQGGSGNNSGAGNQGGGQGGSQGGSQGGNNNQGGNNRGNGGSTGGSYGS